MSTLRTLTLESEKEVREILARFPRSDAHYDPRYLRLFQNFTQQRAIYFHYKSDGGEFLLPFFERELPGGGEKDLVSPWYYGGPLSSFKNEAIAKREFALFRKELDAYCLANGVVSQFQRFNPVLQNQVLYGADSGVLWNRKVVSIDLTKPLEVIRSEYEYKVRKNLKRAEQSGLKVVRGADEKAIRAFIGVYTASMERKKAGAFYYFNEQFYTELFKSFPEEAQLFTTYLGEEVVASELVLGNGIVLHDYLRAAYPQHLSTRPNEFTVDQIIQWAKGAGYKEYSLGGGLTAAPDDSLFQYKKALSPLLRDYYLYKRVHNRDAYTKRCTAEGKDPATLKFESADFFPEYKTADDFRWGYHPN